MSKIMSTRLSEKDEIMLTEITKYYNSLEETKIRKINNSEMIRFLIWQEYNEIFKEIKTKK